MSMGKWGGVSRSTAALAAPKPVPCRDVPPGRLYKGFPPSRRTASRRLKTIFGISVSILPFIPS